MGKVSTKKDVNDEQATPPEQKLPAQKSKQKKHDREEVYLPIFVELVFRFSGLFLVLITLIVTVISFVSGANLLQIVFRTGTTMIVVGFMLLIINSKIASGALEAAMCQAEEAENKTGSGLERIEKIGQDIKA